MNGPFKALKISDSVYWVGAIDWALREFHGYLTSRGTTYNAYLILGDTITLVDTVKAPFKDEMLSRIASVVDPERIRYIVSNHAEMDHSACLPEMIRLVKPEKVFASVMGVKALQEHFHLNYDIIPMRDGETVSLGNLSLRFLETRMLHWPDSMFTYLPEEEMLFSQDGFGMHLASIERFDDEIDEYILRYEAAKYYANIIMPFAPVVTKVIEKVRNLSWPIRMILPDHGPIWRKGIAEILELYAKWAQRERTRKALVVYDTMWNSTARMAEAIAEGVQAGGATAKVMSLGASHRSDVATEVLEAGALVVGSPTFNNGLFPTVADGLTYLQGLNPRHLIGAAFGSYGWSGQAVKLIEEILGEMKVELVGKSVSIRYVPTDEQLGECVELGRLVAEKLTEKCVPPAP